MSMENPFKAIRLRAGLSQYDIAHMTKISKHAVLRLEQGMYDTPLPTLLNFFVDHFKVDRGQLVDDYTQFQITTRENNARLLGPIGLVTELCPVGTHPLTWLRSKVGMNPTELAKKLCISQSVVVYFEKRSVHQHTVPSQLEVALMDADYTMDEISALGEAYVTYRDWLINRQNLSTDSISTDSISTDADRKTA